MPLPIALSIQADFDTDTEAEGGLRRTARKLLRNSLLTCLWGPAEICQNHFSSRDIMTLLSPQDLVQLELIAGRASIRYCSGFYSSGPIVESLKKADRISSWDLSDEGAIQTFRIEATADTVEEAVREVFARYHG